ncbi:MAG: VTC domain-containing protein [Planctomycetota bacterium]
MTDPRWEVKMVCEEAAMPLVLAELRLHPAIFSPLYPDRIVQSIYLDSHLGNALSDNLAGISERRKFRFRWYGPETREARLTLERKRRINQLGDKAKFRLPEAIPIEGHCRHAFIRRVSNAIPEDWRDAIAGLEPVQWIRYLRSYYMSGDRRLRVTVDRNLQASDLRNANYLNSSLKTPLDPILILECKADACNADVVEEFVRRFPLRMDKSSKFVIASAPAHGPIISRGLP